MINFFKQLSFSDISNVASVLGFLLTVQVFINLKSIKRSYIFIARAPELLEKLETHASNISAYQNDFSNSIPQIELELAGAEITLKFLKSKVNMSAKGSINKVLKVVKKFNGVNRSKDNLWLVYLEMQKLISEVKELQSDQKWER